MSSKNLNTWSLFSRIHEEALYVFCLFFLSRQLVAKIKGFFPYEFYESASSNRIGNRVIEMLVKPQHVEVVVSYFCFYLHPQLKNVYHFAVFATFEHY